jgi:hypothetical protein
MILLEALDIVSIPLTIISLGGVILRIIRFFKHRNLISLFVTVKKQKKETHPVEAIEKEPVLVRIYTLGPEVKINSFRWTKDYDKAFAEWSKFWSKNRRLKEAREYVLTPQAGLWEKITAQRMNKQVKTLDEWIHPLLDNPSIRHEIDGFDDDGVGYKDATPEELKAIFKPLPEIRKFKTQ